MVSVETTAKLTILLLKQIFFSAKQFQSLKNIFFGTFLLVRTVRYTIFFFFFFFFFQTATWNLSEYSCPHKMNSSDLKQAFTRDIL